MPPPRKKDEVPSDREILDLIKGAFVAQLKNKEIKLKVGDLVKILEIQRKLTTDSSAEEKFWEFIDQIRKEELKDAQPSSNGRGGHSADSGDNPGGPCGNDDV